MIEHPYAPPSQPPFPPPFVVPVSSGLGDDVRMRLLLPVGRSGWAIAAGYLGLFSMILFPAPISIIVSLVAIRDIRRSKGTAKVKYGMGRAVFGLVMGILGTVLLGIIVFSVITGK